MNKHEMYTYWYMPFTEVARIEIENDGAEACETPGDIRYTLSTKSDTDELLRIQENWYCDDLI
ncbi:DUF2961 domain-containing protein [Paenibacillus sp. HJL G12]|uniref:DUF2961 domain-containing protein n=1 Tax=Paenibacillus dendrobii TaxID=2691084 RepID=A0A7X3IHU4_9BACL|nr:DUF2961 domain-containing protein [Paenibacillus dendrobii]MWV43751.1 DUF2961 domain-containing protein [Paenibacillus dendrobii]